MDNVIAFPGLGIELSINRVALSLFGLSIHWYGVIIAAGFLLAVWYCSRKSPGFGLTSDDLIDLLIFAVPISIIGARIYYVVFEYNNRYYYDHAAMFRIWDGGLAIYGAVIFAVITAFVFARIKKIRLGSLLDVGAMGLLIGQAVGRWGNFVNKEAFGTQTTLPWRMEIYNAAEGVRQAVHPTFLYESLWNLLGFVILHFYSKKRKYTGEIFLWYTVWYGIGRGFIEGMRTDSLYFFGTGLRVSQFWGFFTAIAALGILVYFYLFRERDPEALADAHYGKPAAQAMAPDETLPEDAVPETADEAVQTDAEDGADERRAERGDAAEDASASDEVKDDNGGNE